MKINCSNINLDERKKLKSKLFVIFFLSWKHVEMEQYYFKGLIHSTKSYDVIENVRLINSYFLHDLDETSVRASSTNFCLIPFKIVGIDTTSTNKLK